MRINAWPDLDTGVLQWKSRFCLPMRRAYKLLGSRSEEERGQKVNKGTRWFPNMETFWIQSWVQILNIVTLGFGPISIYICSLWASVFIPVRTLTTYICCEDERGLFYKAYNMGLLEWVIRCYYYEKMLHISCKISIEIYAPLFVQTLFLGSDYSAL